MIHVGTSGYAYPHWSEVLYRGVPTSRRLERYAREFSTVEMNATFYRLPTPAAATRWRDATPDRFVFAVKGSRFLTHMKRLTDTGRGLDRFFSRVDHLGPKLEVVLWQLPPQMAHVDPGRLERFLLALPGGVRHAVEFRHEAWYRDEVARLLDRHGVAFCEHDLVDARPPRATGGFRYLRFHGASAPYAGRYGRRALEPVARGLRAWSRSGRTAYVYFNNDTGGHAVRDARALRELLGPAAYRASSQPSRNAARAAVAARIESCAAWNSSSVNG